MEHMESKMQDFYEAAEQREKATYAAGFKAGILEAARTLSEAAHAHTIAAEESRKIAEVGGHKFAASILRGWANGLEMNAEKAITP